MQNLQSLLTYRLDYVESSFWNKMLTLPLVVMNKEPHTTGALTFQSNWRFRSMRVIKDL